MGKAEEFRVEIDGTYMNVIRFGTGKKNLVIIAGVSLCGLEGQGESVAAAYDIFADEYTVYLLERKKVIPQEYSVWQMADDIFLVLNKINVTNADIYGVSQGGMIAQCLAIKYPRLVNKLVLCSTICRADDMMKTVALGWRKLAAQEDVVALNRDFFEKVYSESFLEKNRELLPVLEKQGTPDDCKRFAILAKACEEFNISDRIEEIKCPVFIIGDENDRVLKTAGAYEIAQKTGGRIYIYKEFSHAVYDEADNIKDMIKEFLLAK